MFVDSREQEDYLTDYSSKLRRDYGELEGATLHKEAWQVTITNYVLWCCCWLSVSVSVSGLAGDDY